MSYSVTHYIVTASFGYTQRNTQNFKCPISGSSGIWSDIIQYLIINNFCEFYSFTSLCLLNIKEYKVLK